MRILIVTQYFWPENFRVNNIAEFLTSKGHIVDILTSYPNYPEGKIFEDFKKNPDNFKTYYGSKVFRVPVWLRRKSTKFDLFLNYLTFIFSAILFGTFKLRKRKYDIVFTFATSPITVAIASIYFSKLKNAKSILWVLDLWPDILEELQIIKNKFIIKMLRKTVAYIYENTDLILAQSKSFKNIILNNYKVNKVEYFPAWTEEIKKENSDEFISKQTEDKRKLKIYFTGNIGEAQNFENIMATANILKHNKDIEWTIVGTGRNLENIKKYKYANKIENLHFLGAKSLDKIGFYHRSADILLVSLKPGKALSSTIPGKVQTYLNSNKFILGFIEGEAKKIIEDAKCGDVVDPNSSTKLAEKIIYLSKNRSIVEKVFLEKRGENYLQKNFNKGDIFKNFNSLIQDAYKNIERIKLIKSPKSIPWNSNFTLSGLNLAFLGYYTKGTIKLHSDLYHWSDGIFFKRFFNKMTRKYAGRDLVDQIELIDSIENVYVFGSLPKKSLNYLKQKFAREVIHIDLPYDNVENLYENYCNFKFSEKDFIILTLPTPKQEQFAEFIRRDNKYYKIICVGGAVIMASGEEKPMPEFFEKTSTEFIWRLRTDTRRRVRRLLSSFIYYFLGEISFKFKKIKKEFVVNE